MEEKIKNKPKGKSFLRPKKAPPKKNNLSKTLPLDTDTVLLSIDESLMSNCSINNQQSLSERLHSWEVLKDVLSRMQANAQRKTSQLKSRLSQWHSKEQRKKINIDILNLFNKQVQEQNNMISQLESELIDIIVLIDSMRFKSSDSSSGDSSGVIGI